MYDDYKQQIKKHAEGRGWDLFQGNTQAFRNGGKPPLGWQSGLWIENRTKSTPNMKQRR
jgi:hypothetical protein